MATVGTSDPRLQAANNELEAATKELKDCKIGFQPRITVVDRKMRLVSDDDVEVCKLERRLVHQTLGRRSHAWLRHQC